MASLPAGKKIRAADLDEYEALTAAWTAYTPTWTGTTGNPTLGNASVSAAYRQVGKTVDYRGQINIGSTTVLGSGFWEISWPVPPISSAGTFGRLMGSAFVLDTSSSATWAAAVVSASATALRIAVTNAAAAGYIGPTVPMAWASGDRFSWFITYEAA